MDVLRFIVSRLYQGWVQSCLRFRGTARTLKYRLYYSLQLWLSGIHRFITKESTPHRSQPRLSKVMGRKHRRKRSGKGISMGQKLISLTKAEQTWPAMLLAILLLTVCFGQRFYDQPELGIRAISPQTFYAPTAVTLEDKKATESRREDVRNGAVQILKIDFERTAAAQKSLKTLLAQGQELRSQAGIPPFLNLDTLSKPTQEFLFQASDKAWETVWRLAEMPILTADQLGSTSSDNSPSALDSAPLGQPITPPPIPPQVLAELEALSEAQTSALQELLSYRKRLGSTELTLLKTRIETRRTQYRKAYNDLVAAASTEDHPLYNYKLFELSDEQWNILETNVLTIFDEMMQQGVNVGTPDDLLRRAIELRVPSGPTAQVRQLTADVLSAAIEPNLVPDEERTRQQAEQAVNDINPVMVSVEKGDLIVRSGEVIDSSDFVLLDYFDYTGRYFNWIGLCSFSLLIAGAVAVYLWVDHRQTHRLHQRDHGLVLLLCLGVAGISTVTDATLGLPAVGLLIGSFYGAPLGLTVILLTAIILPIGASVSTVTLAAGAAAAAIGAWFAPNLRSREEFALLGGGVALTQAGVHFVSTLIRSPAAVPLWKAVFVGSALHGLYGLAWSVVALGVSPYLEHFFDVVTPIRLAELANPNRPLLKRLAAEAPGTFQHTMFVANLAEAAARSLGHNVELVRAGTLYHDIGKMHDPQGFIENQMGGPNKHDLIADPWKSARIIKKHVTEGLVMARKHRLPKAVQAFIPEHQGSMKISYFYQQAKDQQAACPNLIVDPADFSYDGPTPQSPETGITMLADSCEAALRSLKPEASMDDAYAMVNKILRARWKSRQLADSGLSRSDMDVISSVFIQVWQQHNHKRISYPKNVSA